MLKRIGLLVLAIVIGALCLELGGTASAYVNRSLSPVNVGGVAQTGLWGGCDAALMTTC
jgi:hypothetical protein